MPQYEYFCHVCRRAFSKVLTLSEYEEGNVVCPHCGSEEVEQRWAPFRPVTPKKSA